MENSSTINLRPPMWLPIIVALLIGGFYIWGKNIEVKDHMPTTINVSAEGKVHAVPDIARMSFGVETGNQKTAKDAMAKLSTAMDAVYKAVKAAGVAEKDISQEQFYLSPVYDWSKGSQTLLGFQATQTLQAKVRDLDKTSDVLEAATTAGANHAGDVQFTIDDQDALQAKAREEAIAKGHQQALKLASDLGMHLGKLKGFNEGGGGYPVPMMMAKDMVRTGGGNAEAMPSLPLPPGEQEVVVQVMMTYEVK